MILPPPTKLQRGAGPCSQKNGTLQKFEEALDGKKKDSYRRGLRMRI
jgi:hypothetical protein